MLKVFDCQQDQLDVSESSASGLPIILNEPPTPSPTSALPLHLRIHTDLPALPSPPPPTYSDTPLTHTPSPNDTKKTYISPSHILRAWASSGPLVAMSPVSVHSCGNMSSTDNPSSCPISNRQSLRSGNKHRIWELE